MDLEEKRCSKCKLTQSIAEFSRNRTTKDGFGGHCRSCRRVYNASIRVRNTEWARLYRTRRPELRDKAIDARFRSLYGITLADYLKMHEAQGGKCAICDAVPNKRRLSVDHDHSCCLGQKACGNCVRGLLCARCNAGLGQFRDSPDLLASAARYLEGGREWTTSLTGERSA